MFSKAKNTQSFRQKKTVTSRVGIEIFTKFSEKLAKLLLCLFSDDPFDLPAGVQDACVFLARLWKLKLLYGLPFPGSKLSTSLKNCRRGTNIPFRN